MPEPAQIVYPIRMPARPAFREITWGMDSVVAVSESPFTFRQQTYAWPGQRWKCSMKLPPMKPDDARNWKAFFGSLNGQEGTFLIGDSAFAIRSESEALGDPEVDGAQIAGRYVTTKGWTPDKLVARAGDWLEVGGRLRQALLDAYSDDDGKSVVAIWPNLSPLDDGAPIEWLHPKGIFRLSAELETVWDINRMLAGLQISCIEVL